MLAGHVVAWPTRPLAARETDDLERGVRLRVECLPLERLEAAAQDVRLRRPELACEPGKALALVAVEVHLHGLAYAEWLHDYDS
jgi:hypothetical protein